MRVRLLLFCALALSVFAQDREWLAQWEAAQRERPKNLSSQARIAPADEPGEPLIVHGRVYQVDGTTPVAGAIVFAYQTDATGVYHRPGERGWRLKGWAPTDKDGAFEFTTIRPASYPSSTTPAHIHLALEGPGVPRQWTEELRFADDPFVSEAARKAALTDKFANVRPVRREGKTQHVDFHIRAKMTADF